MEKIRLYAKVVEKHKKLEKTLQIISFILLFPFAITQLLTDLFENITNFGLTLRNGMVHGLLRIILKKELQEHKEKYDNIKN